MRIFSLPRPNAVQSGHSISGGKCVLDIIQVSKIHIIAVVGGCLHGLDGGRCGIITRIVCVAAGAGVVAEGRVVVVSEMVDVTHAVGRVVGGCVRCQTRLSVPHQHRHRHPPGRRQRHHLQTLVLPLTLALVPPVLEPYFHLGRGEFEHGGQVVSLRGGQVPLLLKATLQLVHLRLGEENPGLPASPGLWPLRIFRLDIRQGLGWKTEVL